ncbi:MAG: PAS domain S-box protein, partial [Phycisphaerales bacterium]
GIQSLVAVPIVIGGELFGFLGFDSVSEQKNWSNDIISMMKIVAEIFANALERRRTDEALSESESRFRELVENIREVFWMENADGTELLYVSPAYEQVWGRSCQSFYENPRDWIESIHPEDRQRVVDAFSQFRETEKYSEEFRIVRPDGTIRWIWDRGVLIRDEFGEVTRVAGIAKDITERKRAEETLRVREQTLRALINAPTESAILVDAEGTILDINRIAAERLGKSEERLIGMGMYDYLPADIAEYRKAQGDEVLRSGKPVRFQDEREGRYYDTNLYPVFDDEDKVSALAIFSGDITERKKAEASLRENEEKLRNVVERANDGIVILQDGLLKYVNPRTAEITGYTVEEMTNTPFARYVPPDELPKLADIYERRMAGEEIVSIYETAVRHKDGSDVHIEVNAGLITYEGKPADLAFARDITERKRTEEALQRSERMFRTYFELGLVGMAVTSPEKGWIYVNDNLCKMLGYSRDELFQTTWADLTHPEDLQADIDQFEQVLAGKIDGYSMDKRFIRKDGQIVYVSLSVACLRREDGSVEHFIAHLQDITDRKKAKKALQDNEARYRSLVANIPDVVWTSDEKGNTTFISANVEGIYGYSPEEVYSQSDNLWFGRIHPDDIEGVKESFKAVFESGGQLDLEYRVKRKDGEWIWIRDRSIGAYEKDGVKYADGVFSDITERKQAEEALSESEKRYRDLVETSLDMIFMLDRDGNFIFTNRAWSENIGYSGDEAKTMDGFELVLPEDLDHVRKRFASVIGGKVENNLEFRSRTKKGEYRNILINGSPVFDSEGGVIGILGSGMDITERKKGEQALRESEAKFRSLAEQSPNMIFINKQGRVVYANKKCEEIMGYRREEFCSPDFDFLTLIAPESVDTVKENYARHSRGEDVPPYDYTLINRDGERIEAINTSKLIQYEGQTAILGIVTDITERIKAENALRESEERLKILFGSAPDGIYLNDLEGRFVDGNRAAEELIGYEKAEVVGKSFAEAGLLSAEQLPRALARLEKTAAGEPVGPDEFTLKRKDGSHVAVEIRTFPVRIKDEMLSLGIARDITERKKAEQALREERDRAQQYLDVAAVMFVALDSQGNVTLINEKGCELLGWDESEIVGKNWFDNFLPEDIKEQIKTIFLELMAGNIEPVEYHENAILCNDGSQKIIAWHNTVLKDGSGSIIGILSSGQDITERKQGEKVLLDHQAQLKSLASQLSLTEERERRRLATELHDQIGQSLVISKIKLDQLRGSSTSDELTKALEEVCDCLGQVIDDARTLTFDLSSPILYELGLEAAVAEWLTEQIQQKHGIETEFEDDGQQKPLDDDIRTILFRNVRELLINIVKHAQADKVKVSICRADEDIHISIDDDGVGFDPVEVTSMAAK